MEPPRNGGTARERGRVLVIDDEPLVGRALAIFLNDEHDVTTVCSAAEALARLDAGERFDAILCDLMMPEMSGMDFHAAMLERHPDDVERIVFITGGVLTPRLRRFVAEADHECIEKPPQPAALRECIRRKVRAMQARDRRSTPPK